MIVYKKAVENKTGRDIIITLAIPAGATYYSDVACSFRTVSNVNRRNKKEPGKCRASEAYVVSMEYKYKRKDDKMPRAAHSFHDRSFVYRVGRTVKPDYFDKQYAQCSGGIHFYFHKPR